MLGVAFPQTFRYIKAGVELFNSQFGLGFQPAEQVTAIMPVREPLVSTQVWPDAKRAAVPPDVRRRLCLAGEVTSLFSSGAMPKPAA